jgi:hypothetical protein
MFCAEAANILSNAVELAPDETHAMSVSISVASL